MLAPLQTLMASQDRDYTGVELRPHFLLSDYQIKGSGVLAFFGACEVATDHLVDWEDRLVRDFIRAKRMAHFIGEFFGVNLREGVWLQRLFMAIAQETLTALAPGKAILREGDDLFWEGKKLSVSIVTASPVSVLLHSGINIDATGAPVSAAGLGDIGIAPEIFAREVLQRFEREWASIQWACTKVRPVM